MSNLDLQKQEAVNWFKSLRDDICQMLEQIEREGGDPLKEPGKFDFTAWDRPGGGGGTRGLMRGRVFEKAGVNVSEVYGKFQEKFAKEIPGADKDSHFWASGISLVIHPLSPHVPPIHMNTRYIVTTKDWFGGSLDLNPIYPNSKDTKDFHLALKEVCDLYNPTYYENFKQHADEYYYLKHRQEDRGVGGIFYDTLRTENFENDFNFTKDVGRTFLKIYKDLIYRHLNEAWSEEERQYQLKKRGRYVEFNLLYDRGTRFGLETNGNSEAILMSLPPIVTW